MVMAEPVITVEYNNTVKDVQIQHLTAGNLARMFQVGGGFLVQAATYGLTEKRWPVKFFYCGLRLGMRVTKPKRAVKNF